MVRFSASAGQTPSLLEDAAAIAPPSANPAVPMLGYFGGAILRLRKQTQTLVQKVIP